MLFILSENITSDLLKIDKNIFFLRNMFLYLYNDILKQNLNISKITIYRSFPSLAHKGNILETSD